MFMITYDDESPSEASSECVDSATVRPSPAAKASHEAASGHTIYGNSHPTTIGIGEYLETSQAVLRARYKSRYWDILACSFAVALFAWVWWYLTNE